jgi:hypothetical protein
MAVGDKIPFGLADITVGTEGDANQLKFNGKDFLQAEGGEIKISPILEDIKIADFGDSIFDQRVNGFEIEVTIQAGESRSLDILASSLSFTEDIIDTTSTLRVGLTDAKIGTSLRAKGKTVRIHPRDMGTDDSLDIVVYKMIANGEMSQSYENSQGKHEIKLIALPRDGFDATKVGNFFYIGGIDPNAVVAP